MKKLILILIITLTSYSDILAQGTDPAFINLREFYTYGNYGSGRSQAMGGAFTALGGDISSSYINPAGLGFYNRSEYGISVNVIGGNNTTNYIGNSINNTNKAMGDVGQLGIVFSTNKTGTRLKSNSFALSYTTLANFNNAYSFSGVNDKTSIADGFAALANIDGKDPQSIIDDYDKNGFANTEYEMAYMAYLIDHFGNGYEPFELSLPVNQTGSISKSGYLGQYNIGYGANFDDKTYIGANVGIQTLNFASELVYDESFKNKPEVNDQLYYENFLKINGVGVNMTLGIIHRLNNTFNIGASITTPTLTKFTDTFEQSAGTIELGGTSWDEANTGIDELKYQVISPLKANLGVSAYLPNKIGVISAEAEVIGYGGMKINDKTQGLVMGDQNSDLKNTYRNVVNLKAGLELRKGIGRLRAGVNWINDPMANPTAYNLKSNYVVPSVGLGVRTSGFYLDLSYTGIPYTGSYNPYVLSDKDLYYSATYSGRKDVFGIALGSFF